MMLGGCFFLEFFLDTICPCDNMNAEVQVCGQRHVLPGHCVSEEIGMVSTLIVAAPSCIYALITKEKEGQTVANHCPI